MARLHSYYRLCPIIDQKSLFGITADKTKGCVIATIGKNIVNIYRLSDQKQIGGWSSKYHLSSPVLYDKVLDKYIGVFDETVVRFWDEDTVSLDKLKKHKFQNEIWQVLHGKTRANIIIFKNGSCISLDYAINFPKNVETKDILSEDEHVVESTAINTKGKDILIHIAKKDKDVTIITCPLQAGTFLLHYKKLKRFPCDRGDKYYVTGYTLSSVSNNPIAYILWNDGQLDKFDLVSHEWNRIGSVPWILTSTPVSISSMDEKHIALYGSDLSQEGAILVVYNVSLGIGSCRHPLKMYCVGARLWCSEEKLVLEAMNHLGVLPYALEAERSLATLIGSHSVDENDSFQVADWGDGILKMDDKSDWTKMANKGVTERDICLKYFPSLLEQNDEDTILRALQQFTDIPESILTMLFKYVFKQVNDDLYCNSGQEWRAVYKQKSFSTSLLNKILCLPFSDAELIPLLQNNFSKMDVIFLINYLNYLLSDMSDNIDHKFESKILLWCTVLMDAFYQQFLLIKDQYLITALSSLRDTINETVGCLVDIENIIPVLTDMSTGKERNKTNINSSLNYCIEVIKWY